MTSWRLTENFAKLSKGCFSRNHTLFVCSFTFQFLITICSPWTPWLKVTSDMWSSFPPSSFSKSCPLVPHYHFLVLQDCFLCFQLWLHRANLPLAFFWNLYRNSLDDLLLQFYDLFMMCLSQFFKLLSLYGHRSQGRKKITNSLVSGRNDFDDTEFIKEFFPPRIWQNWF